LSSFSVWLLSATARRDKNVQFSENNTELGQCKVN